MMNKRKMMMVLMTLTTVTAASAFAGCGTVKDNTAAQTQESASADTAKAADTDTAKDTSENKDGDTFFSALDTTTLTGDKADASVFAKNKVTLVNLWNIGCTPCVQEIPFLGQLSKDYEGKGAGIVGLYYASPEYLEQERADIEDILSKAGAEYPQLTLTQEMNDSETIANVQVFPTTYVVDSEGNIVNKLEGSRDYDGWKSVIEEELKKAE